MGVRGRWAEEAWLVLWVPLNRKPRAVVTKRARGAGVLGHAVHSAEAPLEIVEVSGTAADLLHPLPMHAYENAGCGHEGAWHLGAPGRQGELGKGRGWAAALLINGMTFEPV